MFPSPFAAEVDWTKGKAALFGNRWTLELRTEPPRCGSEAHGVVLRTFEINSPPVRLGYGRFELIPEPMFAEGPRGVIGHARIASADGNHLYEMECDVARDAAEEAAKKDQGGLLFRQATLEICEGQPVEVSSLRIGARLEGEG